MERHAQRLKGFGAQGELCCVRRAGKTIANCFAALFDFSGRAPQARSMSAINSQKHPITRSLVSTTLLQ